MNLKYGLDAPLVPILYIIFGIMITALNFKSLGIIFGLLMIIAGIIFIHTSLRGKFIIWNRLIGNLNIEPNDKALDLGCGHGAVLIKIAEHLGNDGSIDGVDLWKNRDQSNNSKMATQKNIINSKVRCHTKLLTADVVKLPFEDNQYNLVTASLLFHNIKPKSERERALDEACRVLKPNGTLIIMDLGILMNEYVSVLKKNNLKIDFAKRVGFNGWWTGPWMGSYVIKAYK
ncbi:class I SAM-dependent methyltransferase [Lactobacillus sp. Sy-1]|uniref:class I SAM-dependent methyltransferase n=1 Tax=Lactobacillus sp. Sy-1 TaxID=2109645 RepID=UPI002102ED67|nr:class I SAM-dependent methyltransferase [Lactobacillus sp. Sy-1]